MTRRDQHGPERLHSLDALRGIAALSVVLWHWQHFFFTGTSPGLYDKAALPFASVLYLFYAQGLQAVDLFFGLSGFVFFWLYSSRVSTGVMSFGRFMWLRFSRLYPLHFVTLLLVAAGQLWMVREYGTPFVYEFNDVRHFLLNLGFASSWSFEHGHSFNAPIWSVSVEVLLYMCFFVCCRLLPVRLPVLALISLAGFTVLTRRYAPAGQGIGSFFWGGSTFLVFRAIVGSGHARRAAGVAVALALVAWSMTLVVAHPSFDVGVLTLRDLPFVARFDYRFQLTLAKVFRYWPTLLLFPTTILALALVETTRGPLGRSVSFLGDISYSSYLWHFPLQLVVMAVLLPRRLGQGVYYSSWFMVAFFAVLVAISYGSYHRFEAPLQHRLRRVWQGGRTRGGTQGVQGGQVLP
ncbi:MAG: acyltransferase [Vicinamibacterales bacterium]